jgi:dihydroorotase
LARFEAFASLNGPRFYGLPPNEERIALERQKPGLPNAVQVGRTRVTAFTPETLAWRIATP